MCVYIYKYIYTYIHIFMYMYTYMYILVMRDEGSRVLQNVAIRCCVLLCIAVYCSMLQLLQRVAILFHSVAFNLA